MTKIYPPKAIIAILIYLAVFAKSISQKTDQQPKTIVQLNHFYSDTSQKATYNITGITKAKPLIFLLKNSNAKRLFNSGLLISFKGGEEEVICPFKKITDLCVVPAINNDIQMGIECRGLPCQVEWIIYQPQVKDISKTQPALNLYSLEKTTSHLIGQITCNDPKVQSLDKDIAVYSETPYSRAYHNNVIYLLFQSFQFGFVYIDVEELSRSCAVINFTNVPSDVKPNQNDTKDFVSRQSKSIFTLNEVPKQDFSVECSAVRLDSFSKLKSVITVTLVGWKGDKAQHILSQKIKSIARSVNNDFTFIFKAPSQKYNKLTLQFAVSNDQLYLISFSIVVQDAFYVDVGETAFFSLQKGEKFNLKIDKNSDAGDLQKYFLIEKRKDELKLSKTECSPKQGCQVEVEATKDTQNMLYISGKNQASTQINEEGKGLFEFQEVQFITINNKAKKKIRSGDSIFFRKAMQKGKSYKVHINSPNVIIYAATKSKCQVPSIQCRERTSNFHHPLIYEATQSDDLLINIQGLENTEFQLTIISQNKLVELSDGTAFSYTMDEKEEKIQFTFKLTSKQSVSFNLVSPLNALKLFVSNTVSAEKNLQNVEQSSDGFIQFKKEDIEGLDFTVSVVKANKQKYFTHFTLIASTTDSKQRLEPTVTNYQTLRPQDHKDFLFQFDKNDEYNLGFSVFNLKTKNVNLQLKISSHEQWNQVQAINLAKQVQFVDIREISRPLCVEEGEVSCELFVRITNKMSIEVDVTLVLLSKNAVIELKDGVWQSFPATYMMASSNFYFYPRHNKSNILVLFHSPMTRTRVDYSLFRYDTDAINPSEWPFPFLSHPSQKKSLPYSTNHYISITHQQLSTCWPNCVLLVDFYLEQSDIMPFSVYQYQFFKIMASNSQLQLPQKQKVSFSLAKNQDKQILMDLKYLLNKQAITIYTTSTIGQCSLSSNVYSQRQQICPIQNQASDFSFSWGQHELTIDSIKQKLKQKQMSEDSNIYLCTAVHSQSGCKMTIEYTSEDDGFREITIDSYEDVKMGSNETKYFKISGDIQSVIKVTRNSGFPMLFYKKCDKKDKTKQCKEEFKESAEVGSQLATKTEAVRQQPCAGCVILFKITSKQSVELSLHVQSKFSQIQLKQKVTLSDFMNQHESNKYQLNSKRDQDLIINIHVQEGDIEVHLTDLSATSLMKKSSKEQRVIQFRIEAQKKDKEGSTSFGNFIVYHITVSSNDENKAASYSIGYSSGTRQFILQDGLIVDYELQPKTPHSFFYCNQRTQQHVIYSLTTESAQTLKDLQLDFYSFQNLGEQTQKQKLQLVKPEVKKKTPNPTIVYTFPASPCFQIQLTNPTAKQLKVSMGINHQEVIMLPFNHEYPLQLHKGEYINILSDVNIPGFIQLQIKKCDESNPVFGYTFDNEQFIKGDFMYKETLTQLSTNMIVKAQRIGTLYMTLEVPPDQSSLLTLKVTYSQAKGKRRSALPGRNGQILYQFTQFNKASVHFAPVQCTDCKVAKYSAVYSDNQEDLYQQMVCPNTYFGAQKRTPITTSAIQGGTKQKEGDVSFQYTFENEVTYLGITAKLDSGHQLYYKPVEIATLKGKWGQQSGITFKILIFLFCVLCCLALAVWWRRMSLRGYIEVPDS